MGDNVTKSCGHLPTSFYKKKTGFKHEVEMDMKWSWRSTATSLPLRVATAPDPMQENVPTNDFPLLSHINYCEGHLNLNEISN